MADLFSNVQIEPVADLYEGTPTDGVPLPNQPPASITASMIAMSKANVDNPVIDLQAENISKADELLRTQGEFSSRLDVALQRQQNTMRSLNGLRETLQKVSPNGPDPVAAKQIHDAYVATAQQDINDLAKTALERETVERVHDLLATDPVEAKVVWDLYKKGNASEVHVQEAIKNLKMAQLAQRLNNEAENEGWGSWLFNFATGLIPTNYNFSRAGVVPNTSHFGLKSFFMSGSNLQSQSQTLWGLPFDEFVHMVDTNGPLEQSIRDNATTLGVFNPATAAELAHFLTYQSQGAKQWANVWGVADPAMFFPWGKAFNMSGALLRMGARKASTRLLADSLKVIEEEGTEAAAKKYGVSLGEVSDAIEAGVIKPKEEHVVSQSVDIDTGLKSAEGALAKLPELMQTTRIDNPSDLMKAYQATLDEISEQVGRPLKEVEYGVENVRTGKTETFSGSLPEQGNSVFKIDFTVGKKKGGGWASEKVARSEASKLGLSDAELFQDASGQWYAKGTQYVREEGFITNPLDTPDTNPVVRFWRSSARTSDRTAQQKAVAAGVNTEKVTTSIKKIISDSLRGIGKAEKESLDQVLRFGQNKEKWFTDDEFRILYKRQHGKEASDNVLNAYHSYRLVNDMEWTLRNDEMWKQGIIRGNKSVEFAMADGKLLTDLDGNVNLTPASRPLERIFDVNEGKHFKGGDLSAEDFQRKIDNGYVLFTAKEAYEFPDGTVVRQFLIKKDSINIKPLRRKQLAYSEGGHRAYTGKYFAKQARVGIQPDTGQKYMLNPNTFITGNNKNQIRVWADKMNEALDLFKQGERDATVFDDLFADSKAKFPSGEEFIKAVEEGKFSTDHKIEVMFDREMPSAYHNTPDDVLKYFDPDENALTGYYRTTGQMYYSQKGTALKDWQGEFADTLDPWDTLNSAMYNITRSQSLSSYKFNVAERFKKTYGNFLQLKDLNSKSILDLVQAKIGQGVPKEVANRIAAEQASMARIMKFETGFDKTIRESYRGLAEAITGNSAEGIRAKLGDAVWWTQRHNPVQFLRGLAFDAKLGMFNIGQLPLQMSTIVASIALNPRQGLKGALGSGSLVAYIMSKGSDNVLDGLAKNGAWKIAGFEGEKEFKEFARFVDKTGFMNVSNTHLLVNEWGPHAVWGATSKVGAIREYGRLFFYTAEMMNRSVASRIAWEELKVAGVKPGSAAFREKFIGLADDYSLNMVNESAAAFQHGAASIPTQFWAYNVRMMDAMFGGRFTARQKTMLVLSQLGLFGTAGVPILDAVADFGIKKGIEGGQIDPKTDMKVGTWYSTLNRGVVDQAIYAATGADVLVGKRVATGNTLTDTVKDIFGVGQYGEKSAAEMFGGATGSIAASAFGTLYDVARYMAAESGGDTGHPLTKDTLLKLGKEVSTFNNVTKAWMISQLGQLYTKKGALIATDLPSQDAFFSILGINPAETEMASLMADYHKDTKKTEQEIANQMSSWRTEAFYNPDKFEENMKKSEVLINLAPPGSRTRILRSVNNRTPQSFYDFVSKKFEDERPPITTEDGNN